MAANGADTLGTLSKEVASALLVVREHLLSDANFESLMRRLGWKVESIPPPLLAVKSSSDSLFAALEVVTNSPDPASITALIDAIREFVKSIDDLDEAVFDPALAADLITEILPRQLIDGAIIEYLEDRLPLLGYLLQFLGIIRVRLVAASGNRLPYMHEEVAWSDISRLFSNPTQIFRDAHGWGDSSFDGTSLLQVLQDFALAIGMSSFLRSLPHEKAQLLEEGEEPEGAPFRLHLDITLFDRRLENRVLEAGIRVLPLPQAGPRAPGLAIVPYATADFNSRFHLSDLTDLIVTTNLDLQSGIGLILRPDEPVDVVVGLNDPENALKTQGSLKARIEYKDPAAKPVILIGSASGTRAEIVSASGQVGMVLDESGEPEILIELELQGAKLVMAEGEGDGFLQKVLPANLASGFDLVLGLSSKRGFFFRGSAALEVAVPTHVSIGPVEFKSITIAVRPKEDRLPISIGASLATKLGPLTVTIAGIGVKADFTFPGSGGNLGPLDLDIGFKPPTGLGLSIDGGGFKGGGFIDFEPEEKRYSGMIELEFQDQFSLKAFALLTTLLPNGETGFSLLIIISAEFTPIQLGFGFKLMGVGGLLGLNRTVKTDVLRTGLRDNTLSSILFPTDIIANADRILSDMRQVFPPQSGRFIFGPMAKIGWGTPTLITLDVGLLIEVPEPIRLAILGVLRAILPDERAAILRLQVNFLGVIDFEQEQLSFDASLFDSKLLGFTLTGDMAIRLNWGANANFLLTVGGFHPAYQPPPMNLPAIRRLTLSLLSGDNPRLKLEMYFAVTSNTVQFGAQLELYASAWKFNVCGFLSFDVLFQFNPFYFIAEITAMVSLRIGSSSVASIKLTLTLEGPTPWKAKGTASFKVCWFFTLKIRFNKTFGEERTDTLPDLAVIPLLVEALSAADNWEAEQLSRKHRLESFREADPLATDKLLVHPIGTLKISQKVVPLNLRIERMGAQRPNDGNQFSINNVVVQTAPVANPPSTQESFAPAQFFDMTDEQKLASPSFKNFDSGIRIGEPDRLHTAYAAARDVKYELKYIDSQRDQHLVGPKPLFDVDLLSFNTWTLEGAISKSDLSFARRRKSHLAPEAVSVVQESFAIVNAGDLQLFDDSSLMGSELAAVARVNALIETNPALRGAIQVVPAFELSA